MADYPVVNPKSLIGRAYEILNRPRGGVTSDDEDISVRQIMRAIQTEYPAVLHDDLIDRLVNGIALDPQIGITYECQQLEDDVTDCGCGTQRCGIKRLKVPTFAEYGGRAVIFFFGVDAMAFTRVSNLQEAKVVATTKAYSSGRPAYWIEGEYIKVLLPAEYSEICQVYFVAIPDNPSHTPEDGCFDIWSEEFPILEYLWSRVKTKIMGGEIRDMVQSEGLKDTTNNAASGNYINVAK